MRPPCGSSPQQSDDTANNNSCNKQHTLSLISAGAMDVLAPALKIYPTFFISKHMTHPLRHLVCEIREICSHKLLQRMTPLHFCHEIPRFPKYESILPNGHCVLTQQVYQLASFQSSDATVHKNITYNHTFTQFLLSLIHPNCAINFFLGTLYRCNGGGILTVVRALCIKR